jgi:DNA-directed RNA polymerase specialized sigma24 family protein
MNLFVISISLVKNLNVEKINKDNILELFESINSSDLKEKKRSEYLLYYRILKLSAYASNDYFFVWTKEDIEEVANDTLYNLLKNINKLTFVNETMVKSYIAKGCKYYFDNKIARMNAKKRIPQNKYASLEFFYIEDLTYPEATYDTEDEQSIDDLNRISKLITLVSLLPPQQKKIIELKLKGYYNNKELAKIMGFKGISPVITTYKRAIIKLRELSDVGNLEIEKKLKSKNIPLEKLELLPNNCKEAYRLYIQGLRYAEIALELGINRQSIRQLIFKSKVIFKENGLL